MQLDKSKKRAEHHATVFVLFSSGNEDGVTLCVGAGTKIQALLFSKTVLSIVDISHPSVNAMFFF